MVVYYFRFSDSTIDNLNARDGILIGIEGYKQFLIDYLYFGLEVGWAGTSGSTFQIIPRYTLDTDIDYVPIELNAKYVYPLSPFWNLSFGAGFSLNYFGWSFGPVSDSSWLWGGQFFGELNYKYQNWYVGANIKYQLTQDANIFGFNSSADNLRVGGQVGISF